MESSTLKNTFEDIKNNFFTSPLIKEDDLKDGGLYVDTIEARTGSHYKSPIKDILVACTNTSDNTNFIHLLLGHRGCGKSTEINKLEIEFREKEFAVRKIDLTADTNSSNLEVNDFLILISHALLDICREKNIIIEPDDVKKLYSFFIEEEEIIKDADQEEYGYGYEAGFSFSAIVKLVTGVKAQIMNTSSKMTTIRNRVTKRFAELNECFTNIIKKIQQEDNKKRPIIIFENLDKITPTDTVFKLFEQGYLEKIKTYIIYTFPISMSYHKSFGPIEDIAKTHNFPMIEIKNQNGEKNQKGYDVITKIIEKRAVLSLFEENAIDLIIEKTGGSLRDAFRCITQAAIYAERKEKDKISTEEVEMALNDQKQSLSKRIEYQDYKELKEIHEALDKTIIKDKQKMLEFLKAHVVLEYNGDRWHDLHPLIYDFLKNKWELINTPTTT